MAEQPPPRERIFNVPAVVLALLAVIGVVHAFLVLVLDSRQTTEFLLLFAFIPLRYDPSITSVAVWPGGYAADVWTFVTYAFIHRDLNHLFFNAIWLLAFCSPVARRFGTWRFLAFFAVTAAAGAAAHLATHFGEVLPMIGVSAVISGAMAASMRFAFQPGGPLGLWGGRDEAYRVPAVPLSVALRDPRVLAFLLVWFGINALFALNPFRMSGLEHAVAWQAHIGGFLAGLLAFAWFDPVPRSTAATGEGPPAEPTLH
jgi:membrane associated rhomboid family serine protease